MSDEEYSSDETYPPIPPPPKLTRQQCQSFYEYQPEELDEEGLPTIEAQIKRIELEEENNKKPPNPNMDLCMRVKCLSLNAMGYDIFYNTYNLPYYDRERLQDTMRTYEDKSPEEIIDEFNEVCERKIFTNVDYSRLPMYNV